MQWNRLQRQVSAPPQLLICVGVIPPKATLASFALSWRRVSRLRVSLLVVLFMILLLYEMCMHPSMYLDNVTTRLNPVNPAETLPATQLFKK